MKTYTSRITIKRDNTNFNSIVCRGDVLEGVTEPDAQGKLTVRRVLNGAELTMNVDDLTETVGNDFLDGQPGDLF